MISNGFIGAGCAELQHSEAFEWQRAPDRSWVSKDLTARNVHPACRACSGPVPGLARLAMWLPHAVQSPADA